MPSKQPKVRLLLDSGAFSAWYRGGEINLKDYIKYIKDHIELIDSYVSLDVIPGEKGRMNRAAVAAGAQFEAAANQSYRNHQIMKDVGLSPIPVFHQGENFKHLERLLADGEQYIGISPYLKSAASDIIKWCDECFTILTDEAGRPLVKTHGFGATGTQLINRYPWRSVDSTSWAVGPGYGNILIPRRDARGEFDFSRAGVSVYVATSTAGNSKNRTLDTLGPGELEGLSKYAAACGLSLTELRNDQYARKRAQLMYFKMLAVRRQTPTFKHKRAGFRFARGGEAKGAVKFGFKFVFASQIHNNHQSSLLTRCGAVDRLLSYYELRKLKSDKSIEEYVRTGNVGADLLDDRKIPKQKWDWEHYKDFRRLAMPRRFGLEE